MRIKRIKSFPYKGKIHRIKEGVGYREDESIAIYEGEMDLYRREDIINDGVETARYIIFIPYKKELNLPKKGDKATIFFQKDVYEFDVNNVVLSQLGGVEIYATRSSWDYGNA